MVVFILLNFLVSDFQQKWFIPYGTIAPGGRILVYDSDHDGRIELIFRRWIPESFGVYFAEFVPPDSWDIIESQTVDSVLVWDISDYDNDTFSDLVVHGDASGNGAPIPIIAIYESPGFFSYPTQEVWRDTVGFAVVQPISAYDVDNDGFPEILDNNGNGQPNFFWIYEAVGNNQYDTVYTTNPDPTLLDGPVSTHAFGDFDSDGKMEFAMGGMSAGSLGATYWVYESPANNVYEQCVQGYVSTKNIIDCFSVPDADGDGKMEFVVKGFTPLDARTHAFIFEAIGDNTYEIIKSFNLAGGDYYGGYSEAGDVNGDSIPEIVLESASYVYIIKAAGNDSFYVWDTLPGHASGSCVRVYDIDENGLAEIIISGNDETRIYEYDPGGIEEARNQIQEARYRLQVSPNPFKDKLNIRYQIPKGVNSRQKSVVSMNIYDITGRLVKTLVDEPQEPGYYQERIDTERLANGVYFVVLKQGDRKINKKFILVR